MPLCFNDAPGKQSNHKYSFAKVLYVIPAALDLDSKITGNYIRNFFSIFNRGFEFFSIRPARANLLFSWTCGN
jgi:hypothetical protein